MNRKTIIYIRFNDNDAALNTRFNVNSLSKEWIEHRMDVFYHYTRKSIEAQSNQNFITLLRIHPDSESLVQSALNNYPKLNDNIIFTSTPKDLIKEYIQGSEEFYLSQIDSDDLYHPCYIQLLTEFSPKEETTAIICQKGYIYDIPNDQLCNFFNVSSAVFAYRFMVSDYLSTYQYYPEITHINMYHFPFESFSENKFMILTHHMNIVTRINPYTGQEIKDKEAKQKILREFHLI